MGHARGQSSPIGLIYSHMDRIEQDTDWNLPGLFCYDPASRQSNASCHLQPCGEVAEWLKAAASKAVVLLLGYRGFESHPLRHLFLSFPTLCFDILTNARGTGPCFRRGDGRGRCHKRPVSQSPFVRGALHAIALDTAGWRRVPLLRTMMATHFPRAGGAP